MKKIVTFIAILLLSTSCISTKSTLKNVDDNAPSPSFIDNDTFAILEYSKDKKYGYDKDYPINIYYGSTAYETLNQYRYLNALAGPKGEKITYTKLENCCPFPTKRSVMGVGLLDVYVLTWEGQSKPIKLYLNMYEKGILKVPVGLTAKKN
jgi:hypothetical protein